VKSKILLIEHDENLVELMQTALAEEGFEVMSARDSSDILRVIRSVQPQVIIIDRMIPDLGGMAVCQKIRADAGLADVPIIMISNNNDEITGRITALELGVDDYITTPVDIKELIARIRALQRRSENRYSTQILRTSSIEVDLDRWTASVEGKHLMLTNKEFSLLRELLEAKGRVLTRDALLESIWGHEKELNLTTRTVDIHLSRLRRKLGPARDQILTIRNVGYRMDFSPTWIVPTSYGRERRRNMG